ncbi:MAG TPA: flagellar basal body rod protein FlgB [Stellaceae bacterium]|nr:flagellar basal body rod protein FlgB [Stellaceae bacterium]
MDLMGIPLFDALVKRMTWLGSRQTVLAENVANANTPGYVARDLPPPDFKSLLQGQKPFTLTTTQPNHIAISSNVNAQAQPESVPDRGIDGNGVSLEEEMMKVSETANDFALTTTVYRANLNIIKTVIGNS